MFVLCRLRPQPRPTRFPYTTLFRSKNADPGGIPTWPGVAGNEAGSHKIVRERYDRDRRRRLLDHTSCEVSTCGDNAEDRKSTRLNSSHRCISYAVFCLKKKKKRQKS